MKSTVRLSLFVLCILIQLKATSQSTSVFDAQYFNTDNTAPPIKIGKGFHINDVYRQTRSCFNAETCNPSKLTSQQTGGKKTSIKLFYTETNEQFNTFKSKGASGKVSFLNLFSIGGKKLEEYSMTDIEDAERLIFTASVDFGIYSFETDPQLTVDAKALIDQNKLQDFVKFYGTHYISGVKKESSISVILTKTSSLSTSSETDNSSLGIDTNIPYRGKGSLEIDNGTWTNQQLSQNQFSVSVEINGPAIEQGDFQGQITAIINGSREDKSSAIASLIEGAVKGISDANQSLITQYYYSPFTLYGIDGINWDEKKQNLLTKINEAVIEVYSAKTLAQEVISEDGKKELEDGLKEEGLPEDYLQRIMAKYYDILPTLREIEGKADGYMKELEAKYIACADVYCPNPISCCSNDAFLSEIEKYNLEGRIDSEIDKIYDVAEDIVREITTPECEKLQKGIVVIHNVSSNPYSLYQGSKFLKTLPGNSATTYNVNIGTYNFKASQDSGYLMYPTVNLRTANINKVCEKVTLKVGFED